MRGLSPGSRMVRAAAAPLIAGGVMLLLGLYHFLMFWIDGLTGHGFTGK